MPIPSTALVLVGRGTLPRVCLVSPFRARNPKGQAYAARSLVYDTRRWQEVVVTGHASRQGRAYAALMAAWYGTPGSKVQGWRRHVILRRHAPLIATLMDPHCDFITGNASTIRYEKFLARCTVVSCMIWSSQAVVFDDSCSLQRPHAPLGAPEATPALSLTKYLRIYAAGQDVAGKHLRLSVPGDV